MDQSDQIEQKQTPLMSREEAIKGLESKDERVRNASLSALEQQGASAGSIIVERLKTEAAKRKRKRRMVYWGLGIYAAVVLIATGFWVSIGLTGDRWPEFPWQLFQMFSYMGVFGSVTAATQFQKSAVQLLATFDDSKYIPELVDAAGSQDKTMAELGSSALAKLLPRLNASDREILDTERRGVLHKALLSGSAKPDYRKAILAAMEQVGDERDLPAIKKLAERAGTTAREKEIQEAAKACLPYVELRAEQNRAAHTLLRAATESGADAEALLRPTSSPAEIDSGSLLRPMKTGEPQANEQWETPAPDTLPLQNNL